MFIAVIQFPNWLNKYYLFKGNLILELSELFQICTH